MYFANTPEPEYVDINQNNIAVIALLNLENGKDVGYFTDPTLFAL